MIDVGGGFNPGGQIQRQWNNSPMQTSGPQSMTGGGGQINMGGGGNMMSQPQPPMGGNRVPWATAQRPQQPQRNRMRGGMVDPSYRSMMAAKAGSGMGESLRSQGFRGQPPSAGQFPGLPPGMFGQHFDQSGSARPPQQQNQMVQGPSGMGGFGGRMGGGGMGGMNPQMAQMMQMMQMAPLFQMYNQMSQQQGGPQGQMFY